ncbi:CDK-activating kinase assembly factor MAT1 isoform X2 [Impatiens glandulifera]|uniref:CDK-activating kinase assembly factor MAT1 isoform X2 n=1 Tax=Impatiens glandulifera TaxID=253017 RepID=UPI001FB09F84|nr:CDK-activating kinase assembly factor MAT1 isoform X2 [Impatiens glandulifera]
MVVASGTTFAKEMTIRKRIASIFNKREDDFSSLKEFNDYLEEVEDMRINVPAIEAHIANYQIENAEQIMIAQARKAEEFAAALAASKGHIAQTDIDVSTSSQVGNETGTQPGQYAPAVAGGLQPRPTGVQPNLIGEMFGYDDDEETRKLRAERGGRAGGWSVELSKKRTLEEAMSSIWI